MLFDELAGGAVAIERGAAEAGPGRDFGERDGVPGSVELVAGLANAGENVGVGHPAASALLIRVSSRAMSLQCRSASLIQPRASAAMDWASTRWAARIGSELASVWKLGQCSQMLA
ncbi:hypothetical protein [Actinopolymorpha alba]|uniref:hypothetical protein n=1 Tax=Actinopolymorpha alba TaxID=533267 RepID=UPI00039BF362|nr:hypothetical protein [Actinopolymorpha alba]